MEIKNKTLKKSQRTKFGRIGVLMGGPSSEREVSLKSGKAVYEALKQAGLDVVTIDIKTDNLKKNIRLIKAKEIDCAFIALHGHFGEDGQIQKMLEEMNIPYTGSGPQASKLAMDKIASRKIFQAHGLNVPSYQILEKSKFDSVSIDRFSLPVVIKPATQGSSIGLSIVDKKEDLSLALDLAFSFDSRILIEEYIKGRELTVGILDDSPLPIIEIIPKKRFFDYEAKYQPGMTEYIVPARLDKQAGKKIQQIGL
ncbi:MAG: D-alanine--D-alanine ligase, partial [Candidatus Omnitrophica bacterium]|nr:D-alanine--D-alanine ligase [Candidatus Omnitrophota bacterium]